MFYATERQCRCTSVSSPGLVDLAIGLVIFALNLPDGQVTHVQYTQTNRTT